ncbi:AcrR family transcriptional regulator [Clostridium algifaecis]|uniref:AcrR family transcriptional regulator n=1 Tax=Clostridium algifaecis TaxID=1472040 RepID=A0ABS4KVY5_9CLOT|nr:TetR/AcrR family transcriptional regulator [Clostridium algifaecis]MBP2033591.1 AcrR family transcriptional regulator [Clostridium algifaecis]
MNSKKRMTSRQLQAIERRQQLLGSAKKLFAKNGYYNTSVRSITQSIGMADGLIYHYFPNGKLEILHTIIREGCEVLSEHVNKILAGIDDKMTLDEVIVYFCKEARNTFQLDNELIIIMFREKDLLGRETSELLLKTFVKIWNAVNAFLKKRAQFGEIRQLDFGMATHQLMCTVASTVIMKYLGDNKLQQHNDNTYIERLIQFTTNSWKRLD